MGFDENETGGTVDLWLKFPWYVCLVCDLVRIWCFWSIFEKYDGVLILLLLRYWKVFLLCVVLIKITRFFILYIYIAFEPYVTYDLLLINFILLMQFRIKKVLVRWFKLENKNNWYDYFFFWMSVINPLRRDLIIKRGRSMPFHLSNHLSLVSLIKLFFSSLRSGPQKKKNWHFWDKQIKGDQQ